MKKRDLSFNKEFFLVHNQICGNIGNYKYV